MRSRTTSRRSGITRCARSSAACCSTRAAPAGRAGLPRRPGSCPRERLVAVRTDAQSRGAAASIGRGGGAAPIRARLEARRPHAHVLPHDRRRSRTARRHQDVTVALENGVTLSYVEQGDPAGLPVVLLHGITDSWRSFEHADAAAAATYRVLAITQRGHGDSAQARRRATTRATLPPTSPCSWTPCGCGAPLSSAIRWARVTPCASPPTIPIATAALVLIGALAQAGSNADVTSLKRAVADLTDPIDRGFAREFQVSTLAKPVAAGVPRDLRRREPQGAGPRLARGAQGRHRPPDPGDDRADHRADAADLGHEGPGDAARRSGDAGRGDSRIRASRSTKAPAMRCTGKSHRGWPRTSRRSSRLRGTVRQRRSTGRLGRSASGGAEARGQLIRGKRHGRRHLSLERQLPVALGCWCCVRPFVSPVLPGGMHQPDEEGDGANLSLGRKSDPTSAWKRCGCACTNTRLRSPRKSISRPRRIQQRATDLTVRRNAVLCRLRDIPEMRKAVLSGRSRSVRSSTPGPSRARWISSCKGAGASAFGTLQPEAIEVLASTRRSI